MNSIITDAYLTDGNWFYYWTPTAVAIENGLLSTRSRLRWRRYLEQLLRTQTQQPIVSTFLRLTPHQPLLASNPSGYGTGRCCEYAMVVSCLWPLGAADAMGANSASAMDTAKYFLANNEDQWTTWVSEEAADAIRAARVTKASIFIGLATGPLIFRLLLFWEQPKGVGQI